MNLKTQIAAIIASMSTGLLDEESNPIPYTFRYGTKYDENINGDSASYPAIVLLEPDEAGFNLSNSGQVRDRTPTFIQFLDKCEEIGEQANYREAKIEAMKTVAAKFIVALNNSNEFQDLPDNYNGVVIKEHYDANVVGMELNLGFLVDTQPRHIC